MTSILSILLVVAVVGVVVWLLLQIPMPAPFKNVIIGVGILLVVLWLFGRLGGSLGSLGLG